MASDHPTQHSSINRRKDVLLPMDHGGHSVLLAEVARAFLHTATPSSAIKALLKGVRHHRNEVTEVATPDDLTLLKETEDSLIHLFDTLRRREQELYGGPLEPESSQSIAPLARPATPAGGFTPSVPVRGQKVTVPDVPRHRAPV